MSHTADSSLEALLQGYMAAAMPSRRAQPRFSASYPILLEFDLPPSEPLVGVTVNICRSGLLARVEAPIASGTSCLVTFLPRDRYLPELVECPHCGSEFSMLETPEEPVRGTVVRSQQTDGGAVAAILFEELLDVVG